MLELVGEDEAVVQMGIIKMKLPIEDLENEEEKKNQLKWLHVKIDKRLRLNLI